MNTHDRDTGTPVNGRRAAMRSAGLGLVALAALPLLANDADAKKRGKKRKKNAQPLGQGTDRCLPQVERCETVAATFCENASDRTQCRAALTLCCQALGTCNGDQSVQCVIDAFTKKV